MKLGTGDRNTHAEVASGTISDRTRNGVPGKHEVEEQVRDN